MAAPQVASLSPAYAVALVYLVFISLLLALLFHKRLRPFRKGLRRKKTAATMPSHYLKPGAQKVRDLPFGQRGWIDWADLSVDLHGKVWLDYDARLRQERPPFCPASVELVPGGCVVRLSKETPQFTPRKLYRSIATYLPVLDISFEDP